MEYIIKKYTHSSDFGGIVLERLGKNSGAERGWG